MVVSRFYKYLDMNGARATLTNATIKFSIPSEFNDPFDLNVRNFPGFDIEEQLNDGRAAAIDFLRNDPQGYAIWCGIDPEAAITSSNMLSKMSQTQLEEVYHAADTELMYMRENLRYEHEALLKRYETSAIFCASLINDSILMWGHYAGKHTGVVLGFEPNLNNDSILTILEPVIYVSNPPEIMPKGISRLSQEDFLKVASQLYRCKHQSWKYENEVRLYIPSEIEPPYGNPP